MNTQPIQVAEHHHTNIKLIVPLQSINLGVTVRSCGDDVIVSFYDTTGIQRIVTFNPSDKTLDSD
jgi:hypothetical protein